MVKLYIQWNSADSDNVSSGDDGAGDYDGDGGDTANVDGYGVCGEASNKEDDDDNDDDDNDDGDEEKRSGLVP